jgi:hypothetical protein
MSQKTSTFEPATRRLERQAVESIHEDMDHLTVICEFDLRTTEKLHEFLADAEHGQIASP